MKLLLHLLALAALVGCRSNDARTSAGPAPSDDGSTASAAPESSRTPETAPEPTEATDEVADADPPPAALPEIRYFMIADT